MAISSVRAVQLADGSWSGEQAPDARSDWQATALTATDYTSILTNQSWNGFGRAGSPCIVTFSFGTTAPAYVTDGSAGFAPGAGASYATFTATEKAATRDAIAQWAAACGIVFIEVPAGQGELAFHKVDLDLSPNPDSGGFAISTTRDFFNGIGVSMAEFDGDVFIDSVSTPTGTVLAYTLLHEIGHTLGLKHPFDGDPTFPGATTSDTVLAYGAAVSKLGTLDPQAARYLYGNAAFAPDTLLNYNYSAATKVLTQNWGSTVNRIMGTGQKDSIHAGDGDDKVAGFQNNDVLKGGNGNDQLYGGPGDDTLYGGPGDDIMLGGNGVFDDSGTDTVDYSAVTKPVTVQLRYYYNDPGYQATGGHIGNDLLYQIDNVIGGAGADRITGNQFANVLSGKGGNDILMGGLGSDTVDGGAGADNMSGGYDNDIYVVDNAGDVVDELADAGNGVDLVRASVSFSLADATHALGDIENLTLIGTGNINGTGNALANIITGNSGNNRLDGGAGADRMIGGRGDDSYYVASTGDRVVEKAGEGTDTVNSSISFSLNGIQVEKLNLTGGGNIGGTGNSHANTIVGNSGNNVLNGGLGADTLDGQGGKDVFLFNSALGGGNVDTLLNYSVANDSIKLENAIFTALAATGILASSRFVANAAGVATTPDHRIVYETDTGKIFYDSNGSAAGGAILFAKVDPGLAMTASEFTVI